MSGCSPRSSKLGAAGSAGGAGSVSLSASAAEASVVASVVASVALSIVAPLVVLAARISWLASAAPFSCGTVSFVIVLNLEVFVLSEIVWSERQPAIVSLEVHRHGTTSSVAAPILVAEAELAPRIAFTGSGGSAHLR